EPAGAPPAASAAPAAAPAGGAREHRGGAEGGAPREGRRRERGRGRRGEGERPSAAGPAGAGGNVDFWETWVDERTKEAPSAAGEAEGAPVGSAPEARGGRRSSPMDEEPAPLEPGTTRLYLNLGRRDRVRSGDVLQLVTERVGLPEPPRIQVRNTHTYLVVKDADVERVINGLRGGKFGDREINCEPARGR
ncbi:MAG TPA: DbpA RNA binding domain-containing protein, partial [Polyangia bacterium]